MGGVCLKNLRGKNSDVSRRKKLKYINNNEYIRYSLIGFFTFYMRRRRSLLFFLFCVNLFLLN